MRIAVVGIAGGWSSEALADAVGRATGERVLVDLDRVRLDLAHTRPAHGRTGARLLCPDQDGRVVDLCEFDALCVKKVAGGYAPHMSETTPGVQAQALREKHSAALASVLAAFGLTAMAVGVQAALHGVARVEQGLLLRGQGQAVR